MHFERPVSEEDLDSIVRNAYGLACKRKYHDALAICNWLIEEKTTKVAGYRQRAAVKEHMADINGAIQDLQYVLSCFDKEPADFHALGILLLQNGETQEAIKVFGKAIDIGESTDNHYYTNSSLLFRSEAYLKRTDFNEAISDTLRLPEGYKTYISGSGMRSKEEIYSEALAALNRKKAAIGDSLEMILQQKKKHSKRNLD